jgi:hypothetical protein
MADKNSQLFFATLLYLRSTVSVRSRTTRTANWASRERCHPRKLAYSGGQRRASNPINVVPEAITKNIMSLSVSAQAAGGAAIIGTTPPSALPVVEATDQIPEESPGVCQDPVPLLFGPSVYDMPVRDPAAGLADTPQFQNGGAIRGVGGSCLFSHGITSSVAAAQPH